MMLSPENYKRLTRLYIPDVRFGAGENFALSDGQAHYLRNVMRKQAGDRLRLFNGQDGDWLATIVEINKKNAIVRLDEVLLEQKSSSDIFILASPVKKEAFDLMIEKSCELGAASFIPVVCDHTVVHKINQERLQAVAVEAAEQCERLDVMQVSALRSLKDFLNSKDCDRDFIFCIERKDAPSIAAVAQKLAGKPLAILIGPEGGFSEAEAAAIAAHPRAHPASLGPRILKAETALIAALACIQTLSPQSV